ncbi:hypothetical protein BDM02DRAFT_2210417 [Thelephora ganbajun]|uniref:Uncharacterized protein n=1 Tax=Thelephora ganbajun TaxID=370292 RepID=A0ACB6ZGD4_THEGA|nr:hypothetical protein BDM02DRAFT_2210417 [Thelephora ganbajun]
MAYFSNNDNLYAPTTTPEEFDLYPFLQPQTFTATQEVYRQPTFASDWDWVDQAGSSTTPSINFLATNYEPVPPTFDPYPASSHGSYLPTTSQSSQPNYPGTLSWENPFMSGQGWETMVPTLNATPTNPWGSQQYGMTADMSYMDDTQNHHRPRLGVIRIGMTDSQRFTPYEKYGARLKTHGTVEAGPSTRMFLPILCDTPPTTQPTGGISETTADAEQAKTITEDEAPVSNFYCSPIPRVTDCLLDVRHPKPGAPVEKG